MIDQGKSLIAELSERGITLTPDGDGLIARPSAAITAEVAETIRENKATLLITLLVAEGMSEELAREEVGEATYLEALGDAWWDAADDGEEEDRFLRRCVSEGRIDDLVRVKILGAKEADAARDNHPDRYELLTADQKESLRIWIEMSLEPSEEGEPEMCSYGMKHLFETSPIGSYIDNGQMKGAMLAAGYEPSSVGPASTFNWGFRAREAGAKTKELAAKIETKLTALMYGDISIEDFLFTVGRLGRVDKHGYKWVPIWGDTSRARGEYLELGGAEEEGL